MLLISVIIPNYNGGEALDLTLQSVANQTLQPDNYDVIIVDDGSTDNSLDIIQDYHQRYGFKLIQQPNLGPATARNNGFSQTNGRICVFLDSDMIPSAEFLEQYLHAHRAIDEGIVIGRILPWKAAIDTVFEKITKIEDFRDLGEEKINLKFYNLVSCNFSIHHEAFRKLEGFDSNLIMTEDTDLGYRSNKLGIPMIYCPTAVAYHNHSRTFNQCCQRIRSSAFWTARLFRKHPEMGELIPIYQDILPIDFQKDSIKLICRKIGRYLISITIVRHVMEWTISKLEGKRSNLNLLKSLYWKVLGGYRFVGFRSGMKSCIT